MSQYVAFLRAINAGRGRTVKMEKLREVFESLGFSRVETFIASGNVVFETKAKNARSIEKKIEQGLQAAVGIPVTPFVRNDAELDAIIRREPLRRSKVDATAEIYVLFLSDVLDDATVQRLIALKTDSDEFHVCGREVYWLRRRKPGGYDFTTVPFDKVIRKPFTVRNSRTVKEIADKFFGGGKR